MRSGPQQSVAIVGSGPAGASLATYLARGGTEVALFGAGERPPIIVGESLVPAVVPLLRELGIEDEVASYSVFKPGATFIFDQEQRQSFRFDEAAGARVGYAYNVPRDRLDATILGAAERAGARIVNASARIERDGDERVRLSEETLARSGLRAPPTWIVDASGRRRLLARLLNLPEVRGARKDIALHAHLDDAPLVVEGNVHTERLERGWAWRIPLPDRVSIGLVMPHDHVAKFGDDIEEQYDNCLRTDASLRAWGATAKRVTPVVKYTNYQLRATRGVGANWALVGDAFGFIDPVFSSGLGVALEGAFDLAQALSRGTPRAMRRFEQRVHHSLAVWQRIADAYYDGRLFTLLRVGESMRHTFLGKLMDPHFRRHMPRVFTGEAIHSRYSTWLVHFMTRYGLAGNDPAELAVR